MEKYINTLRNDSDDVMKYLNEVMNRLAQIESENSLKDKRLYNYDLEVRRLQNENLSLHNQINYYKSIEASLNNSMAMVRNVGEQIKNNALKEREVIISDAKSVASRILNDALIKAERVNMETDKLKRDVSIYKNKVRSLIECQLEVIDDIEKVEI
jgi:cell division initiation protein